MQLCLPTGSENKCFILLVDALLKAAQTWLLSSLEEEFTSAYTIIITGFDSLPNLQELWPHHD